MVDIGRIILGVLCGYVGLGLLYNVYLDHYISERTIGELLKSMKNPPLTIKLGNAIFFPIQLARVKYIEFIDRIEENEDI